MDPNEPVVVDAQYDDEKTPEIAQLAKHASLKLPHVEEDKGAELSAAADHETGKPLPDDLHPADLAKAPFRYAGRLNVHWSSANQYVHGSAQFVAPSLILTAGHCVHWAGQWNTNLYFLKRYENGVADEPIYRIDKIGVLRGWVVGAVTDSPPETAWPYDLAVLKIKGSDSSGHAPVLPLSDAFHAMTTLGYPADYDAGQTMLYSNGERMPGKYDGTVGLHPSHMGFGASGGAWFVGQGDNAMVMGLNSFKMSREPATDYSPVLGDAAMALLDHMAKLA